MASGFLAYCRVVWMASGLEVYDVPCSRRRRVVEEVLSLALSRAFHCPPATQ